MTLFKNPYCKQKVGGLACGGAMLGALAVGAVADHEHAAHIYPQEPSLDPIAVHIPHEHAHYGSTVYSGVGIDTNAIAVSSLRDSMTDALRSSGSVYIGTTYSGSVKIL